MRSSNEIKQILVNAPIKVNFAGLRGTTMSMQKDGWELNVEVERCQYMHGFNVRLAGRHQGLQLMMYSGIAQLDFAMMASKDRFLSWFDLSTEYHTKHNDSWSKRDLTILSSRFFQTNHDGNFSGQTNEPRRCIFL